MIINNLINKIMDKTWDQKNYTNMAYHINTMFKDNGPGIYKCHIIGSNSDIVSKLINKISGPFTHSILIWYDPKGFYHHVKASQCKRITDKFKEYYKDISFEQIINTKALVLGSADRNGMNYFDYAHYQNRQQIITKVPLSANNIKKLVNFMLKKEIMNKNYDYTGLFFWLYRLFDDERAWYCSEQIEEVLNYLFNLRSSEKKEPSPTQLAYYDLEYNRDYIISNTSGIE